MTAYESTVPAAPLDDTVTGVIVHHPRRDAWEEYEHWLLAIKAECQRFSGYLSTDVIRPVGSHTSFTVIIRFAGVASLQVWIESNARRQCLQRVEHLLEKADRYVIHTGLDFFFTPPSIKPPVPWKQYLITLSAIFPLTVIVPWVLSGLLSQWQGLWGMLAGKLLVASCIVFLMVYVIMPRYTRWVSRWLFR
jgi:antibiotic biosynthesis monooxygenase (ABM) superfamily enzyme